jgi:hypothetical protein
MLVNMLNGIAVTYSQKLMELYWIIANNAKKFHRNLRIYDINNDGVLMSFVRTITLRPSDRTQFPRNTLELPPVYRGNRSRWVIRRGGL